MPTDYFLALKITHPEQFTSSKHSFCPALGWPHPQPLLRIVPALH